MKRSIRTHLRDFLLTLGLVLLAGAIAIYILDKPALQIPVRMRTTPRVRVELASAQAVQPGPGQTVRGGGRRDRPDR